MSSEFYRAILLNLQLLYNISILLLETLCVNPAAGEGHVRPEVRVDQHLEQEQLLFADGR